MKLKNLKIYLLAIFTIFLFNLQTTAMKPSKPQSSQNTSTASNQTISLGLIQIDAEQLLTILYHDNKNHSALRTILGNSTTNDFTNKLTQPNVTAVSKLDICFLPKTSIPTFTMSITIVSRNNIPTTYTAVLHVTNISEKKIYDEQKTLAKTDTEIFFFLQRYCEVPNPLPSELNNDYNTVLNDILSLNDSNLLHIIHNTPTNDFTIYTLQNNKIHILKITFPNNMYSLSSTAINLITKTKIKKFTTLSKSPVLNICRKLCHGDYSFEKIPTSFNFNDDIPSNEEKSNDNNGETLFLTQHGKNKEKKHSDKKEKEKKHSNESNDGDNTSSTESEDIIFKKCRKYEKGKKHSNESNDGDNTSSANSNDTFLSLSLDTPVNTNTQPQITKDEDIILNIQEPLPLSAFNSEKIIIQCAQAAIQNNNDDIYSFKKDSIKNLLTNMKRHVEKGKLMTFVNKNSLKLVQSVTLTDLKTNDSINLFFQSSFQTITIPPNQKTTKINQKYIPDNTFENLNDNNNKWLITFLKEYTTNNIPFDSSLWNKQIKIEEKWKSTYNNHIHQYVLLSFIDEINNNQKFVLFDFQSPANQQ